MKNKIYFSIRVVIASSQSEAIKKVNNGDFVESHLLSDVVLTEKELLKRLKK